MSSEQQKQFDQINKLYEQASNLTNQYWRSFSSLNTWEFWVLLGLTILPLVALYFFMDRKKAFRIGFYGFSFHMLFHYIDMYGFTNRLWGYPYKLVPALPTSITLDASLVPVCYMLLYQWTLSKNKNYYLYATGLSFFFAFLLKPALFAFRLFQMYKGVNYFHLFIVYIAIMLLSKWLTNVFLHFENEAKSLPDENVIRTSLKRKSFLSRVLHLRQKAK